MLGQNPGNIRNKPNVPIINRDFPLFQNLCPPICKDNNVEQTIDTRLVQVLPIVKITLSMSNLTNVDVMPLWLDNNPPLNDVF